MISVRTGVVPQTSFCLGLRCHGNISKATGVNFIFFMETDPATFNQVKTIVIHSSIIISFFLMFQSSFQNLSEKTLCILEKTLKRVSNCQKTNYDGGVDDYCFNLWVPSENAIGTFRQFTTDSEGWTGSWLILGFCQFLELSCVK